MRTPLLILTALTLLVPAHAAAHKHEGEAGHETKQQDISVTPLSDHLHMIQVGGGNIAVSVGTQGIFMVDNGLSENKEQVMKAVKQISDQSVRILVNTHWHFDHAGNNETFGSEETLIIAQENVRKRLKAGGTIAAFDKVVEPAPLKALPVLTYDDEVKVHLNDHAVEIISIDPAHTDGDSVIYWTQDNIIHTGDLFFNGFFPFIDASSGGNLRGMIAATDKILNMIDDETKIIPGHGPLATKSDLENYNQILKKIAEHLKAFKDTNQTKEQWMARNPLADLDAEWGDGFLPTEKFTDIVWDAY